MTNGVKQDGVLSPNLFCVYIDGLLTLVSKAGFGCFPGFSFLGALVYADDVVLLAPSPTCSRSKMLRTQRPEYYMLFSAKKPKCLVMFTCG